MLTVFVFNAFVFMYLCFYLYAAGYLTMERVLMTMLISYLWIIKFTLTLKNNTIHDSNKACLGLRVMFNRDEWSVFSMSRTPLNPCGCCYQGNEPEQATLRGAQHQSPRRRYPYHRNGWRL